MQISFSDQDFNFQPWRPEVGRVFSGPVAFDCETTLIDVDNPTDIPIYILGAAFDGRVGVFVRREHVESFFHCHVGLPIAFHNAAFDLAVIDRVAPSARIYNAVDQNGIWCTQILHKLYCLGTTGDVAGGKDQSTLEKCAAAYLNLELPKDSLDANGDSVRLSYHKWLGRPASEIPTIYLEYLAHDVIATWQLCHELHRRLQTVSASAHRAFGFVTQAWFDQQWRIHGPQTHHTQLKAAIVLRQVSANGLHLDVGRRETVLANLERRRSELHEQLRSEGYLASGPGSNKALQNILRRMEARSPGTQFPRTDSGMYSTSQEGLQDLAVAEPFIATLLQYHAVDKLHGSFVKKMGSRVLHPSFAVLMRTGRTSSFGEINAQNLPKDDDVRSCFVPSPGHIFVDADYAMVELVTLAQAVQSQFGLRSQMAEAINVGTDLHRLVAAQVASKPIHEVTKLERNKAKAINFGRPGGMGTASLQQYAKANYRVPMTEDEVISLMAAWMKLFPEMESFLRSHIDVGACLAEYLGLTPLSHSEFTGSTRFLTHPDNRGRERLPHPILGQMALKVLRDERPTKGNGTAYGAEDIDYFWTMAANAIDRLPKSLRSHVRERRPSSKLHQGIKSLVGRGSVVTLTGRVRAAATYTACHNTLFQGLAADGAKLALWKLWRAGYRIVNFVHDEVLVEIPENSNWTQHAETIRLLMIEGMKAVVPDVRVEVSFAAMDRWYKNAEAVHHPESCHLILWEPRRPLSLAESVLPSQSATATTVVA